LDKVGFNQLLKTLIPELTEQDLTEFHTTSVIQGKRRGNMPMKVFV
jgi:hypothetical protein